MNLTTRFFIYAPFALFVVLAVGVSALWFTEASAFSKRLDKLNGHALMPGVTLHFASKTIEGFPFRLDAIFKDLRIDVATPHGPSSWRSANFALHRVTYDPDKTLFEVGGNQLLTWTDENGAPHEAPFAVGALHASAIEDSQGLERFDLASAAIEAPGLSAGGLEFHARRDHKRNAVDLYLSAQELRSRGLSRSLFGDIIEQLTLSASATPEKPLAGLEAAVTDWPSALRAFRTAGGRTTIEPVEIQFSRLHAIGKGSVILDANGRPEGILDFKLAHYGALLAAESGAKPGLVSGIRDRAAKAGANAMGELGVVIGAKNGIIYAGEQPLGTIEPVF